MNHAVVSNRTHLLVWGALLVLLGLTLGAAEINLGFFKPIVALTIAVAKMLLVMLYFMHVRYSRRLIWAFASAGFCWLLLMIVLTMSDYVTRTASSRLTRAIPEKVQPAE